MKLEIDQNNNEIEIGSDRSFGIFFSLVFFLIGVYPLLFENNIRLWSLALSSVFLFFGVMIPSFLHWPNKLWFKIGLLLSTLVTPLVMSFLFFVVFSPIGILFKLINKDLLDQKIDKSSKSYWVLRKNPIGTMKNQF